MAGAAGNTEVDFGAAPGNVLATVAVTGQSGILTTSLVEAFFMAEQSTDHLPGEHVIAAHLVKLVCETPVAGVGFTIYALADQRMHGKFKLRWVWAD